MINQEESIKIKNITHQVTKCCKKEAKHSGCQIFFEEGAVCLRMWQFKFVQYMNMVAVPNASP